MTITEIAQILASGKKYGPIKIKYPGISGYFYPDSLNALRYRSPLSETPKGGYTLTLQELARDDWEMVYS
jgi:hypothetical protein